MLESYLKVTHYCVFFLSISASFDSVDQKISTWIRIVFLSLYLLWPFFMIYFLKKKRKMLDDKDFNKKFKAMYNENKTNKLSSVIYNSIFCFRRLMLILSLYLL